MIRYALRCDFGHQFEAWFSSSTAYDEQIHAASIRCPDCGSLGVEKAPMAPAVVAGRKAERAETPVAGSEMGGKAPHADEQTYAVLKELREHLKANADDVGTRFAEEARKIHHGEAKARDIYGRATLDEAKSLLKDDIFVLPLPKLPQDHN